MALAAPAAGAGRKRDRTRQRLLEAANRRFQAHGYAATTAAAIAEEAGVTERTFFRYFPSKADVLATNWQARRDELNHALALSQASELVDVVGEAMHAFAEAVRIDIEAGVESVSRVFEEREAATAAMQVLLSVEHDLAVEIAKRAGRSSEDFEVRTAAYAAVGVFRAALRAVLAVGIASYITSLVDDGVQRLRPLFSNIDRASQR
ncbi:TetR family transcriptional regulator [Mycobacterium sp.]|uniref:TetR family transcriptional regulator n=1 Tax=Mycobacterium sp. TaxID=1785 RepID=UPI002C0C48FF|nr:TetR family transcriptional regulator [Mycobacterium sp.]HTQ22415.1 TetR family transcriptional regulator [Mycobacterium sp.]